MRKIIDSQMKFGEVDISQIQLDLRSRDDIPKLMLGLQHIYCNLEIRKEVFAILEKMLPQGINRDNGRPGMDLWKILVLGTLRLNCNWDYDRLKEMANNHRTLRQMLGHSDWEDDTHYPLQTLKDNLSLFTEEILDEINQVVVKAGHSILKKKEETILKGRCDSFVLETNVHYPTDINLLFDAVRKIIQLIASVFASLRLDGWRQSKHQLRKIKRLCRLVQKLKESTSQDETKKQIRKQEIQEAHLQYIGEVEPLLLRVENDIQVLKLNSMIQSEQLQEIETFISHARRQIDQIRRRVIQEEVIPHHEKVFSLFEPYTEWISKGKAGVPFELGLNVCILEDQYGFILHHMVMQKQTDDKVAVPMVRMAKAKFPTLDSCSFDKGFYSPSNKIELQNLLGFVILPKKGRLSLTDIEEQSQEEFIRARFRHSAVESAINALENHSLDRCPDRGLPAFKRFTALAILARNLQMLGNIIQKRNIRKIKKLESKKQKMQFSLSA